MLGPRFFIIRKIIDGTFYGEEGIVSERSDEVKAAAEAALADDGQLKEQVGKLESSSRRERQQAAAVLKQVSKANPEALVPYIDNLIDALNRPEAQTRWESLESLSLMIELDSRSCGKAMTEAEIALFDEESGPVRLAAMRFLCRYGATTAARSDKAWPLIDEGIQCYHGDLEFNDMLLALIDFSSGKLSQEVKDALAERMAFDAGNGKGTLQRRAQQILDNLK